MMYSFHYLCEIYSFEVLHIGNQIKVMAQICVINELKTARL